MAHDFKIRKYKCADHEAVCRIFYNGMVEHVPQGCKLIMSRPHVLVALGSLFSAGAYFHSWICGVFLGAFGTLTCVASIYYCFHQYPK